MVAIVSIEILLPFNITNNLFGKIAYYNKEGVNNVVQFPAEDSKVVIDFSGGCRIEGSVVIILFKPIEICHVLPFCTWACNSFSFLLFLTMSFHINPISIPHFIRTQKANMHLVAPSFTLIIVRLTSQILELDRCIMVPSSLQPINLSIWKI